MTPEANDSPDTGSAIALGTVERGLELLIERLDPDLTAASRKYQQLRRRLVRLFEWRGAWTADDLADETLTRVARKLGEGARVDGEIEPFARGVARLVFLEFLREQERERRLQTANPPPPPTSASEEANLACLDRCLERIDQESRDTILGYYTDESSSRIESRRVLAERLGVSATALRIRALRIRDRLQSCMEECLASRAGTP
ncbi:MAG: hypothetical protein ACSLFQ_22070 [Thermoanaerobaculia bacterium]